MNNRFLTWSSRLLLGCTAFLAGVALAQALIVTLVLSCGQDIQLHRWSISQKDYYELRQIDGETVSFEYHYDLNGEEYSGEAIAKAVKTNDPSLSYWAMPLGHVNAIYQLKVWDKLPMFAIPLLQDYQPFKNALIFSIASLVLLIAFRTIRRRESNQSL